MPSRPLTKSVRPEQSNLFKAVSSNRPRTIERILKEHPDLLDAYHPLLGVTPLWSAFSSSYRNGAVDVLIKHGADVSLVSRKSCDTLLSMALKNYPTWVPFLLEKGIRPCDRGQAYRSNYGLFVEWSDLDLACQKCCQHVPVLLEYGANPNQNPIMFTSSPLAQLLKGMERNSDDFREPVLALIRAGADPNHCVGPHEPAWFRWWELMTKSYGQQEEFQKAHGLMLERVGSPLMRWSDGSFLHVIASSAAKEGWNSSQLLRFLEPVRKWLGQNSFEEAMFLKTTSLSEDQVTRHNWCFSSVVALSFSHGFALSDIERVVGLAKAWVELGADPNEANSHGQTAAHKIASVLTVGLAQPGVVKQFSALDLNWLTQDKRGQTPEGLVFEDGSNFEERASWKNQVMDSMLPQIKIHKGNPRL